MPLTRDCRINPFRAQTESFENCAFLLHAILALSSHHLAKMNKCDDLTIEMYHHRSTALHLFSHALSRPKSLPLLDTLLILVNLEVNFALSPFFAEYNLTSMSSRCASQRLVRGVYI